jgi:hypothetical protein
MRIADLSVFQAIVFVTVVSVLWFMAGANLDAATKRIPKGMEHTVPFLLLALAAFLFPFFLAYYAY